MKALLILILLLIGSSYAMELSISGNFTGSGFNESCLEVPGANITGNNSSLVIRWEDGMYGRFERPM